LRILPKKGAIAMAKDFKEFSRQMRRDRAFRRKILAAWKDGDLDEVLLAEGYGFLPEEFERSIPQVSTDIRAGIYGEILYCVCGP
jgi:hypothetical protein